MTQKQRQRKLARRRAHLSSIQPARIVATPTHMEAATKLATDPWWVKLLGIFFRAR